MRIIAQQFPAKDKSAATNVIVTPRRPRQDCPIAQKSPRPLPTTREITGAPVTTAPAKSSQLKTARTPSLRRKCFPRETQNTESPAARKHSSDLMNLLQNATWRHAG